MKQQVTAVFDIGKTNKKFFLFDSKFREVYREYATFSEIKDEDGHPTENLEALEKWVKSTFEEMLDTPEYEITSLNFSCYGASLVHLDSEGRVLTPLYNYMKPLREGTSDDFYQKYGPEIAISRVTGGPKLGMLNAGMQLYWLKKTQLEIFKKIAYSLHLPQYLSYLFTKVPISEYTSIGCHTLLWDYEKKAYHKWVHQEGIDQKLPLVKESDQTITVDFNGQKIAVGPGIHDSSAALIPYIRSIKKPFVLISTGTWSISINPFNTEMLEEAEIEAECLFNMRTNGDPVKVSRLFLGNEYKLQIKALTKRYDVSLNHHKTVAFDRELFSKIEANFVPRFKWFGIVSEQMPKETTVDDLNFEQAYHQLLWELVLLQEKSVRSVIGNGSIDRIYVDGGFANNEVYLSLLAYRLSDKKIRTTDASLGSALGAALVISKTDLKPKFLKKKYALKKHTSF